MDPTIALQSTPFDGPIPAAALLVGRVLFGLVLAFMGLDHLLAVDGMAGYAGAKGLPAPRLAVLGSGALLVLGGGGIAAGVLVAWAAAAVALFMLASAVLFHDFWAAPEERRQEELTQFLKNTVILGAALVFLALSAVPWPYAVGL